MHGISRAPFGMCLNRWDNKKVPVLVDCLCKMFRGDDAGYGEIVSYRDRSEKGSQK